MTIGPRIWKTGLAVTFALLLCREFNLDSPIFAVIAAIVSMRPSVTQSLIVGGYRIAATIIGGIIGLLVLFVWGSGPFAVGFAVILAILVCVQFKLQEAIVLTGITVSAVMVDVQGSTFDFALERLIVTLLGLVVGIIVNLIFYPPKREEALLNEIRKLNYMLKSFYIYVTKGFLEASGYNEEEIELKTEKMRLQFEEVRKKLFEVKKELGYFASSEKVKVYEKIVSTYYLIFERIVGIHQTELNRIKRKATTGELSEEYLEIVDTCRQLLTATVSMHDSLADYYFAEHENDLYEFASACSEQSDMLIKKLREKISEWHLVNENRQNNISFLEISTIGYEMEQIYCYLNKIKKYYKQLTEIERKDKTQNMIKKLIKKE